MGVNRDTAIILVSTLDRVCSSGAIQDVNDDHGLAIRITGDGLINQQEVIGVIPTKQPTAI